MGKFLLLQFVACLISYSGVYFYICFISGHLLVIRARNIIPQINSKFSVDRWLLCATKWSGGDFCSDWEQLTDRSANFDKANIPYISGKYFIARCSLSRHCGNPS